jgi:hypothetical protein
VPAPEVQQIQLEPFHFVGILVGNDDDAQDALAFEPFIYRTMRQRDLAMHPLRFEQQGITLKDRNLLIDAICRYHYKLSKTTNTFYRFVGLLDRYLSAEQVSRQLMKIVGCAAFLIASKIEDIRPTGAGELVELADRTFSATDLFSVERQILNAINFDTTFATPLFYLTHFMRITGGDKAELLQARYILEICQSHEKFHGTPPSLMASTAIHVVRALHGQPFWPVDIAGYTMYSEEALAPWASVVYGALRESDREETRFMRRKYGSDLFLKVALFTVPDHLT